MKKLEPRSGSCMIPSSVCRPPHLSSSRSPIQFRLCRISYICRLPKVGKKARNSSPRSTPRIGRRGEDQKKQGEQNKVLGAALAIDPSSPYPCIRGFILPLSFLCLFCVSISSSIHSPTTLPRPLSLPDRPFPRDLISFPSRAHTGSVGFAERWEPESISSRAMFGFKLFSSGFSPLTLPCSCRNL